MPRLLLLAATCLCTSILSAQTKPQAKPEPPANGRNPVVSPDGLRIQYASDSPTAPGGPGAYFVSVDGKHISRLATSIRAGRPVWSADGKRLLFVRAVNDTIRVASTLPDGTAPTDGGFTTFREIKGATVSPDGQHVVFGAGTWTSTQLFAATLGSSAPPKSITVPKNDAWWCQAISRDSKRVAVGRSDASHQMQVWVMNIDGTEAKAVTNFTRAEGSPQCPAWSFDGRKLAVQSAVSLPNDTTKHVGNIWIVDVATGHATMLGKHPTTPYLDELPSWFPDGKRVAFQSNRTGRWEVWVTNIDGTGTYQLTH